MPKNNTLPGGEKEKEKDIIASNIFNSHLPKH
jgi:hypothetical protein